MLEVFLYTGNIWLIIGLALAILELTIGTLIFFLPMGVSGIITGLFLKLQENNVLSVLLDNWAQTLTFWAVLSLILSLLLNFIVLKKDASKDINQY
jgi:membrane protein implicated in regulation of membrane protease activity|tara:strand:+ start:52 stop:339 length:288 start_codon:yes stop_codon:yes gene_type:complete